MATRPYQGFPYTQPHVTDAPSIDAATASRWNNLPRRPVRPQPPRNVLYVELPEEGGSQVSRPNTTPIAEKSDLPELDETPVIYIDVPESSSSDVACPASPPAEPEYVQETIFYDQFENRRIDQRKEAETPDSDSGPSSRPTRPPPRPAPPNTLSLSSGASGSSGYGSSYNSPAGLPASLSKEASLYGRTPDDDGFPLSPIPVSEFPEPPPAYSEIEREETRPVQRPQTPASIEPPRTIVITQGSELNRPGELPSPIGLPNPTRKVVYCQHCGQRVHTMVIWETGPATHLIAIMFMCFMLIPLVILVYWAHFCKYRNHYCPNCNKKIGHEIPFLCTDMTYTHTSTYQGQ